MVVTQTSTTDSPSAEQLHHAKSSLQSAKTSSSAIIGNKLKHFSSGMVGGVVSAIALQPADLLKTRIQQAPSAKLSAILRSIRSGPSPITTLWRGSVPSAIRSGIGSGLYFTSLDVLRQSVSKYSDKPPTALANLLTGATARVAAGLIIMPVTVIKVRYESSFYTYSSMFQASKHIYTTEGVRGFFSGFGATAIRDAPYAGVYVTLYELVKSMFNPKHAINDYSSAGDSVNAKSATAINMASGLIAGTLATTLTNPFDALKTRIQLFPETYTNLWTSGKKVVREEGVRALFDGLSLRIARKAFSSALAWTAYEEGMRRWRQGDEKRERELRNS